MPLETFTSNGRFDTPYLNANRRKVNRIFAIAVAGGGAGGDGTGGGGGGVAWRDGGPGDYLDIDVGDGGSNSGGAGNDSRDGEPTIITRVNGTTFLSVSEGDSGELNGQDNGQGGSSNGYTGGGGGDGRNLGSIQFASGNDGRGGEAGTANGGGTAVSSSFIIVPGSQTDNGSPDLGYVAAGGGGSGVEIKPEGSGGSSDPVQDNDDADDGAITGFLGSDTQAGSPDVRGGDGANYGGGGGAADKTGGNASVEEGNGGDGVAYITWVSIQNYYADRFNGEQFTIEGNSWWDGDWSENYTPINTNTQNRQIRTRTFVYTDSRNAESQTEFEVYPDPIILSFTVASPTAEVYDSATNKYTFTSSLGVPLEEITLNFQSNFWRPRDEDDLTWEIIRTDTNAVVGSGSVAAGNLTYVSSSKLASGNLVVPLPRSVPDQTPSLSPLERTFRVTLTNGTQSCEAEVTVNWKSDDNPANGSIILGAPPGNATLDEADLGFDDSPSLLELEARPTTVNGPGQGLRYICLVEWEGTDMNLSIRSGTFIDPNDPYAGAGYNDGVSGGVNTEAGTTLSRDGVTFSSTLFYNEGVRKEFYVRFRADPFNTDTTVTGQNDDGLDVGSKTTPRQINLVIGAKQVTFDIQTREPVVEEVVDYFLETPALPNQGITGLFPNPDIDTVDPDPTSQERYITDIEDDVTDDIEIPVEIKTDDPDVQVRINGGGWQNMREL